MHLYYEDYNPEQSASTNLIDGYYFWGHYAQKKGYSGVGIFSKKLPNSIIYGINQENFALFNQEGRYIQANFDDFCIISSYFPSGSSSEDRIIAKFDFLDVIYPHLLDLSKKQEVIICADFNIAHNEIDLKNWKGNLKNAGFLPQERKFVTDITQNGYVDVFRKLYPNEHAYTWWSQRGQAYNNNVGWRIDYHLSTTKMADLCKNVTIHKEPRLSDHAMVIANFNI
jgi:exodeoxyribonuclease-3